jgi:hypothetical protein
MEEPKFVPAFIEQLREKSPKPAHDADRIRHIVRNISKVSILSVQRKNKNAEVMTREVMIPLYQKSASVEPQSKQSANFQSKSRRVFNEASQTPGPGSYNPKEIRPPLMMDPQRSPPHPIKAAAYLSRDLQCPFTDKCLTPAPTAY